MAEFSIDRFVDRYAERTSGMSASEVRALFAVAARPDVVSLAGGMPYVEALPAQEVLEVVTQVLRELGPGVRVTCSHCQGTANIAYHTIAGGSDAIRAESCDHCHTYRKILYQEKDVGVEPVADDLASLALDLLMTEHSQDPSIPIQAKLKPEALRTYLHLLQMTPLILTSIPSPGELLRFQDRISAKDVHVVAAAVGVSAAFLLTLDKLLQEQVRTSGISLRALTPGAFITTVLPAHVDYARVR